MLNYYIDKYNNVNGTVRLNMSSVIKPFSNPDNNFDCIGTHKKRVERESLLFGEASYSFNSPNGAFGRDLVQLQKAS